MWLLVILMSFIKLAYEKNKNQIILSSFGLGSKFLIYIYKSQKDRPQRLPSKKYIKKKNSLKLSFDRLRPNEN